jgi:RNA polymerase sigma-70 factor (ECF subfamily)
MASGRDVHLEDLLGQRVWLGRLARHLAGQESEGDDLAQEAWLTVHRNPPDPARPPRPWLAQVLRNLVHTRRRNDQRRARRERDFQGAGPDRAAAVDEIYDRVELQRFVSEQVMALDEPLRTVVVLCYFEGLDSGEVAHLTGTPAGTVRWRLKQAIERLRAALDARHGGDRRAWVAILAPGVSAVTAGSAPAATATRATTTNRTTSSRRAGRSTTPAMKGAWVMASSKTKAWLVSLVGVGLLAASGVALWWAADRGAGAGMASDTSGSAAGPGAGPDPAAAGDGARGATPPPKLLVAAAATPEEQTAAGCAAALARAREELDALEREARGLIPALAFDGEAPNPALRAEVMPQLDRDWPATAASQGITRQVECRSWACCMSVFSPVDESPEVEARLRAMSLWFPAVNRLRELQLPPPAPLGVAMQWVGSRPAKDRQTGRKQEEFTFCFGAPPGASGSASAERAPAAAQPESLEACQRELALARERQRPRLAQLAAFRPSATLFAGGVPSPALTARVQAAVDRNRAGAGVECRSGICRLRFAAPPEPNLLAGLRQDDDIGADIYKEQQTGADLYLTVAENGYSALSRLRAPLRQPSIFADCPTPEREGNVLLRLLVPQTGIPNENGRFDHASVQLVGGTLAGTAAAACLTDRIATLLTAHELPRPVGGHFRIESWTWRPGHPPQLATPPPL